MNKRQTTLDEDGWELESGEERHRETGGAFFIPSKEERYSVQAGMFAKLIFHLLYTDEDGEKCVSVERMWVQVTERLSDGSYAGTLANSPCEGALSSGDKVHFSPEHIIGIDGEANT
jgi:hypothetical protein